MKTVKGLLWGLLLGFGLGYYVAEVRRDQADIEAVVPDAERKEYIPQASQAEASQSAASLITSTIAPDGDERQGSYVGNRHTRVYHEPGDDHLPAEENRVYFASVEEAEEAGYRPSGQLTASA
jgi:Metal binding domain of Ada